MLLLGMSKEWKVGDVVLLKSGGPKMTVSNVTRDDGNLKVWCTWFDGSKKNDAPFPADTLEDESEPLDVIRARLRRNPTE